MIENEELNKDYLNFSEQATNQTLPDDLIFKKIGELDKKYKNNKLHYQFFEGILSNIGSDQNSIKLLNYVVKRLKAKKNDLPKNKYYYDLGNTIFSIANIEFAAKNEFDYLLESKKFREAKIFFMLVTKDDSTHFERAGINIANIFKKFGRNYEALFAYDRVLEFKPNFGMALGNKAIALEYYTKLSPQQSLALINNSYNLLKLALRDSNLIEIGGQFAIKSFQNKLKEIENYFNKTNFTPKGLSAPKHISKYNKFILEHNLYLNYDFGYYYDKQSLYDNFFPNFIEKISDKKNSKISIMSDKIYFSFQVFNQLMEDFITARYSFFQALNLKCKRIDKKTNYIYTYDYTSHSLKYGMLKSIFSTLYNCLDKIGHLVKYYFYSSEININSINNTKQGVCP